MGTRADFYVGKGKDAEWIGSIAWDGYREGISGEVLFAKSEDEFRQQVDNFLGDRNDATFPKDGWPWPWDDSSITDCSYWFFDGQVWDETRMHYTQCATEIDWDDEEALESILDKSDHIVFPNMTDRKNVTFGERSGIILIGG